MIGLKKKIGKDLAKYIVKSHVVNAPIDFTNARFTDADSAEFMLEVSGSTAKWCTVEEQIDVFPFYWACFTCKRPQILLSPRNDCCSELFCPYCPCHGRDSLRTNWGNYSYSSKTPEDGVTMYCGSNPFILKGKLYCCHILLYFFFVQF